MSQALEDIQQHPWPPPDRCQMPVEPLPLLTVTTQIVYRHVQMPPGAGAGAWGRTILCSDEPLV